MVATVINKGLKNKNKSDHPLPSFCILCPSRFHPGSSRPYPVPFSSVIPYLPSTLSASHSHVPPHLHIPSSHENHDDYPSYSLVWCNKININKS